MRTPPKSTCVLVIGGGPGGSTAAALLARQGCDVVLVEREHFPRYHIGESLLPSILTVLDLLGAREKAEKIGFQRKQGAFFEWGEENWGLNFGELDLERIYAYQVERGEFDHMLLKHAASQGVQVFEGVQLQKISFESDRPVSAKWTKTEGTGAEQGDRVVSSGSITFDYLIDASGRNGVMATRYLRNRRYHEAFRNVAIWGYWEDADRLVTGREGDIVCGSIPNGWIWAIPLREGKTSVGVVLHKDAVKARMANSSLTEIYAGALEQSQLIKRVVKPGSLISKLRTERDYSYVSGQFCGRGYYMVGDAACFLDPLLSSGVHLATYSALLCAASIGSTIRGEVTPEEAAAFYEKCYRQAYLRFLVFLSAFYDVGRVKESYFWEAQQLSERDVQTGDLKMAFLNLVAGIRDIKDVQSGTHRLVLDTMKRRISENLNLRQDKEALASMGGRRRDDANANAQFFTAIEGLFALNEQEAIEGLFIASEPHVRLARSAQREETSGAI